ncbi:MAG: immunoglobulin domain-containing protein [Bacteroidota bacterium]|nr:immunoglobulin domain-containing protein [Bacteroidota bacterium]
MKLHFFAIAFAFLLPLTTLAQSPQITTHPGNKLFCINDYGTLQIEATGAAPLSYQWYKEGNPIPSETSEIIIFDPVELTHEGEYYCEVSNGEGSVNSETAQVIVFSGEPEVATLSSGGDFCEGNTQEFSVTVTDNPTNYEWFKNGTFITGSYGPSITLSDLNSSDTGIYYCELSNACGTSQTDNIDVNVLDTVSITSQPVGQTVCEGDNAVYTIEAEGSYLEYQWYDNGTEITGEITTQLIIENVQTDNSSSYYCVVSNMCNSVTSNSVGMTVNVYPQVTAHPNNAFECLGESVSLISTASGTPTITGQWFVNGEAVTDSVFSTLTVELETSDSLFVYHAFTNGCGTVNSDSAIIIPILPPTIIEQPVDTTVCLGNDALFRVKVVGTEPFNYQWQFNEADVNGSAYSGENTFELQISEVNEGHEGSYTCIISNECGQIISDARELDVVLPPNIVSQPDEITLCEGNTANFEMIVQGTEPFEFAWMNPGSDDIIGTNQSLVINGVEPQDDNDYYCIVSNECADVPTDTVSLNVKTLPDFVLQPEDLDACHGDSAALIVSVTGTNPMDLLWFRNEGAITGAEDSLLVFNPAETLETGYFFCVAMNECGITESDEVHVNIGTAPAITWQPYDQSLCENETLTLYSGASGENVFYQWFNNGVEIPGQNDTILLIPAVDDAMSGEFYFQAYNGCAAVNSETVVVEIFPAPEFDLGEDQDLCDGESIILSTDVLAQSYSWNEGLSHTASYEVNSTGEYTLAAVGDNGCTGYDTVYVEFHPYHTVILSDDMSNCGHLTLDVGEGAYSYDWNTGSTEPDIEVTESGTYYCTTEGDAFGCISSDTIDITILTVPVIDLGDDHTIARDSSVTLSVEEGFLSYYWSNGTNMNEAIYTGNYLGAGTHEAWVMITAENGCTTSDTVQIIVLQGESVGQIQNGEMVSIYPNPASETVTFEFDLQESLVKIDVLDMNGRVVLSVNENQFKGMRNIELSALQSGLYIINLQTKSRSINYRLIKE